MESEGEFVDGANEGGPSRGEVACSPTPGGNTSACTSENEEQGMYIKLVMYNKIIATQLEAIMTYATQGLA